MWNFEMQKFILKPFTLITVWRVFFLLEKILFFFFVLKVLENGNFAHEALMAGV